MRLPSLPYKGDKTRKSIFKFLGINLTDNTQEGEFSDTQGLSSEHYPTITQRNDRTEVNLYSNVTDIFEWNGKFVVVAGTALYFDGVSVASVSLGRKQFAVVNTHLIVMPDCLDIDISTTPYTYKYLTSEMKTAAITDGCIFKNGHDIKSVLAGQVGTFIWNRTMRYGDGPISWNGKPVFYSYGTNIAAVQACWVNGAWDLTALAALRHKVYWDNFTTYTTHEQLDYGQIFIPTLSDAEFGIEEGWALQDTDYSLPNENNYNNKGYFCVLSRDVYNDETSLGWEVVGGNLYCYNYYPGFVLYCAEERKWSDTFEVGDVITCTGASSYNFSMAKITAIDDTTNTMTVKGANSSGEYTTDPFPTTEQAFATQITFKSNFPELDFICERSNRLWGVSNDTKTLYVSGLGKPSQMYDYSDNDTASWSVAIGSEGDFTGMCSYGGATCIWKENSLIKCLGDYPSNFYTNEYKIAGVQEGSDKSMTIINETLLYKGVNGVYSFAGSTPTLISSALGRDTFTDASGGTDGERYYISMKKGTTNYLFTYDLVNGIWLKEDSILATCFARDSELRMVTGGKIYKLDQSGSKNFDWWAEFVPFYTMAKTSSSYTRAFGKMGYQTIHISFEMPGGSRFQIFIKEDNGQYRLAYTQQPTRDLSVVVPLRIGRCDKFQIKLVGHGEVKVRGIARDYLVGSER